MKKIIKTMSLLALMLLPFASNVQAQSNDFVKKAKIAQFDGKYKGADACVTVTLDKGSNGGAFVTVDFKGKTLEEQISTMWLDSNKKVWPLYDNDMICLLESDAGIIIEYKKDSKKLTFKYVTDADEGDIDVSRVVFIESKDSMRLFSDEDKQTSFDYLKVFFKRAE